jgi:DNA-binding NarL/FixJ family response regulator
MERLSIFLVDPNQLFREGMKLLLNDHDCDVAGEARSLHELTPPLVPGRRVDLVLVGSACGPRAGEAVLGAIRAHHPYIRSVFLADLDAAGPAGFDMGSADARLGSDVSVAMLVGACRHIMASSGVEIPTGGGSPALAAEGARAFSGMGCVLRWLAATLSIRPLVPNR